MKNYKEVKFELGNAESGKAEWQNPQTLRESVSMTEGHAADLNSQFVTTGIKYKLIEEAEDLATEPPATEPPATEPPATEPPATEPPATEPAAE